MKTVNIVKGLQLKTNLKGDKIQLRYSRALLKEWDNNALNEYSLFAAAQQFKRSTIKRYFSEMLSFEVERVNDIVTLKIIGPDYRKKIDIIMDPFNARFIEI